MGSKREKYPEKCPWDLGPNQHLAKEEMDFKIRRSKCML